MQILHGIILAGQSKGHLAHLPDVRSSLQIRVQHILDQLVHALRVLGGVRNGELPVLDGQRALPKGQREEAELVEHAAEGPDVRLGRNALSPVQIDHLGSSIRERRVLLYLLLHHSDSVLLGIQRLGRGRAKVTEHKVPAVRLQDVLHLQVAMNDRRLAVVQTGDGLGNITEDGEHLGLREANV